MENSNIDLLMSRSKARTKRRLSNCCLQNMIYQDADCQQHDQVETSKPRPSISAFAASNSDPVMLVECFSMTSEIAAVDFLLSSQMVSRLSGREVRDLAGSTPLI